MRRATLVFGLFALGLLTATGLVACDSQGGDSGSEAQEVVESGTYTGTITEVVPEEDEIYLDVDGKELELYFIDKTELTEGGEPAPFSALQKGQKVEVKVKKVGKRLDPLSVKILE